MNEREELKSNANSINFLNCYLELHHQNSSCELICSSNFSIPNRSGTGT